MIRSRPAEFELGQVAITRLALNYAGKHQVDPLDLVRRQEAIQFLALDRFDRGS